MSDRAKELLAMAVATNDPRQMAMWVVDAWDRSHKGVTKHLNLDEYHSLIGRVAEAITAWNTRATPSAEQKVGPKCEGCAMDWPRVYDGESKYYHEEPGTKAFSLCLAALPAPPATHTRG